MKRGAQGLRGSLGVSGRMGGVSGWMGPPPTHTHCTRWDVSTSLQMGCSASVSQNSHASNATFSSLSCVLCSMY